MFFILIITKKVNDKQNPYIKFFNQYLNGIGECKAIISKNVIYNKINYVQNVYQIDFKITEKTKFDKATGKCIFTLKFGQKLPKNIYIDKKTDRKYFFLYDFEYNDKKLNKCEQFNIFKEAVHSTKLNSKDLLIDSMNNLIDEDNKFSLELFLELLDFYYKKNEGELLIPYLEDKWDYIYNCKNLNSKYISILIKLKENIEKESLDQTNNKIMELLSNLIFIYKTKNEKEKIQEMINQNKSYWNFYSKIIVLKLDFYSNLGVEFPKGLINIMLKQKYLTYDNISKLLRFGNSLSEILEMIINNFNMLYVS